MKDNLVQISLPATLKKNLSRVSYYSSKIGLVCIWPVLFNSAAWLNIVLRINRKSRVPMEILCKNTLDSIWTIRLRLNGTDQKNKNQNVFCYNVNSLFPPTRKQCLNNGIILGKTNLMVLRIRNDVHCTHKNVGSWVDSMLYETLHVGLVRSNRQCCPLSTLSFRCPLKGHTALDLSSWSMKLFETICFKMRIWLERCL